MPYFHHYNSDSLVNNKCCPAVVVNQQRPNKNGLIKQIKSGYLLHFKKRLFGKAWREEFVVLYEDSSVIWFRDRDRLDPEGGIFLKDAPEMLAAGKWVSRVPNKPEPPEGCDIKLSIAMGSRHRDKVQWFICKSEEELIEWMSAINKTLPPPPPPPEELRESRMNLAKLQDYPMPPPKDYYDDEAAANELAEKLNRIAIKQQTNSFSDKKRSFSAGRLNHCTIGNESPTTSSTSSSKYRLNHSSGIRTPSGHGSAALGPKPMQRQMSFQDSGYNSRSRSKRNALADVATGVMVGGLLTQWNAGPDCWDWGMGWGWTSWNAAFCGTCAIEQAALASHVPSLIQPPPPAHTIFFGDHEFDPSAAVANAQFSFDDHEIGELGDAADVGGDFGGDFGAF